MERGPPKNRIGTSIDPKPISLALRINVEQWNAFDTFWAANKALPFWFLDQTRGDVQLTTDDGSPIYTADGAPLKNTDWWLCMFGDARPAANNLGAAQYSLSFNLAVL
ncbi:hypothetical protein ASF34_01095 [Methylobacterium sp. Leaf106]|nr:hypothetical protein ASF34_01095 [Methylobacterium sp. Leaf106]